MALEFDQNKVSRGQKVILVQQRKQAKIGFETFRSKYIKLFVSSDVGKKEIRNGNALDGTEDDLVWEEEEDSSQVEEEPDCDVYDDRITPEQWQELFGESDDEEEFHGFWRKTNKQTNKQTALLGATKYEKRNDQCFIVLKLALELSKYRYRGYLFVFKIYCSNFILEFQIICLFYLTDEN